MTLDSVAAGLFGSKLRIAGSILGALVVVGALAVGLGVVGVPGVAAVHNQFGAVNESTAVVQTDLVVHNPNPVGVSLGGASVNYTVSMNDVAMASGHKDGLSIRPGNTTLHFTTAMRNDRIPKWWYTHVKNGEHTDVVIDATVRSSLLGGRAISIPQQKSVDTDLIGGFDSNETRPVDANQPLLSDPVLYLNRTRAGWDRAHLSPERTPMNVSFTVYNPKSISYAVSEIGYEITMNNLTVGEGRTREAKTLPARTTTTLHTQTAIENGKLDEWWVSHLRRNQTTDLRIDFYAVVDTGGVAGEFRIPLHGLDYHRRIETDIFGTKAESSANATAG